MRLTAITLHSNILCVLQTGKAKLSLQQAVKSHKVVRCRGARIF
jgi:hypothetical protein